MTTTILPNSIKTDSITDAAGSGAPNFPNGLSSTGSQLKGNNIVPTALVVATSGTVNLTNTSPQILSFTNATTVNLPSTATLSLGWTFTISNNNSVALAINTSTSAGIVSLSAGGTVTVSCINLGVNTTAAWIIQSISSQSTTPSNVNALSFTEGSWSTTTLSPAAVGGNKQLIRTTITCNYSNGNGTALTPQFVVQIKDGGTTVATRNFSHTVSSSFNGILSYTFTTVLNTPAAGGWSIVWVDSQNDGGSKTISRVTLTADVCMLW